MKQTIEIEVPDGKKAIWKDGNIVFDDIKSCLPKTWEEFCKQNIITKDEVFINNSCSMIQMEEGNTRCAKGDKNVLPNAKAAEQHLALMQLHQLRDFYRQGWIPSEYKVLFGIIRGIDGCLNVNRFMYGSRFLSFPNKEIAKEFLTNFRDIIERAGDLI